MAYLLFRSLNQRYNPFNVEYTCKCIPTYIFGCYMLYLGRRREEYFGFMAVGWIQLHERDDRRSVEATAALRL